MRNLWVAFGKSVNDTNWVSKEISWEELVRILDKEDRTRDTLKEYKSLSLSEKTKVKDHGGFLGGRLSGGKKTKEAVLFRSLLTLDLDQAKTSFLERYLKEGEYECFIYSTHNYTPTSPRLRLVFPLSRDVTMDEYNALSRLLAAEIGLEQVDKCSFEVQQMMFYQTTPLDGERIHERIKGKWLNPDEFFAKYPNYKDCSSLPTLSKEKKLTSDTKKKKDPLSLEGIVGAFCRTYPISLAIETFLKDVYESAAQENRYTYLKGESYGGLIVYDDKLAYSHHATDPASSKCLNAFELVKIHKFGDTPESYKQMAAFASTLDEVKEELVSSKYQSAKEEFESESIDWHKRLHISEAGRFVADEYNLHLILSNDEKLSNFALNTFSSQVEILGPLPWDKSGKERRFDDYDEAGLKHYIATHYVHFSNDIYETEYKNIVKEREFNSVRDYLGSLPKWDKVKRVEDLFIKYLEADDDEYVRTITRKVFAACVARILTPGIKFDAIPVIDGEQGIGKSSIIKSLIPDKWFSDQLSLTDMNDKTAPEKIQGNWILEIGELAGMKKADIEKVKSFVTCTDDKYRPSYGRNVMSHPRQCVIFATVNGRRGYLRDITGNRRFWIIKVNQSEQCQKFHFDDRFRDQFWAEALEIYKGGEKLYLEGEMLKRSEFLQASVMEKDDRLGMVEDYLSTLLTDDWDKRSLEERRRFLAGEDFLGERKVVKGTIERIMVCTLEIWCECFGKNMEDIKKSDSYDIAAMMEQLPDWHRPVRSKRLPIYGKQKIYERKK